MLARYQTVTAVGLGGVQLGHTPPVLPAQKLPLVRDRFRDVYSRRFVASNRRMDRQLTVICALTFVIHLIGTLAYAVRIAGVRTGRIAVSFALFNIFVLESRTTNSFQGPFLAKRIERNISNGVTQGLLTDFRWILLSATVATFVGALLIPTFQRLFSRAVLHFQIHRSVPALLMHGFFKGGLSQLRENASMPSVENMTGLRRGHGISTKMLTMNVLAVDCEVFGRTCYRAWLAGCGAGLLAA